jgi:Rab family, other
MGILLMYDVTNLESFNNLSYWLRNIQEVINAHFTTTFTFTKTNFFQNAAPDVVKVLAGNKCECTAAQRAVDKERGDKVSQFEREREEINSY